jgi:hypothetical protein
MNKHYVCICLFILCGCSAQRIILEEKSETIWSEPDATKTSHFFLSGIGQTHLSDATRICGKGNVAAVETELTILNGFLTIITYGIYTPRTVNYYCKSK